jgi:hypothetical protein
MAVCIGLTISDDPTESDFEPTPADLEPDDVDASWNELAHRLLDQEGLSIVDWRSG